jgi:hypothetical protein
VIEYEIVFPGITLSATAETYIGLVVRGPQTIIEELAGLVARSEGVNA